MIDEMVIPPSSILLFSDASGVYIPQRFATEMQRDGITGVSDEDWAILEAGPEHEHYWDTWNDVLNNVEMVDNNGAKFWLHQDGDCWAIPKAVPMFDDENVRHLASYMSEALSEEDLRQDYYELLEEKLESDSDYFFRAAETFSRAFDDESEYDTMPPNTRAALDVWAREGRMGGGFVRALLENDLMGAMSRADLTNRAAIDVITKYIYNRLPAGCWGSVDRVLDWPRQLKESKNVNN